MGGAPNRSNCVAILGLNGREVAHKEMSLM